jgi:hypothetical protein
MFGWDVPFIEVFERVLVVLPFGLTVDRGSSTDVLNIVIDVGPTSRNILKSVEPLAYNRFNSFKSEVLRGDVPECIVPAGVKNDEKEFLSLAQCL